MTIQRSPEPAPPVMGSSAGATGRGHRVLDITQVCPFLAGGDGSWRSAQPSRMHQCTAVSPGAPLTASKQRTLCLVDAHASCATYLAAAAVAATGRPAAAVEDAGLWPDSRPVLVTLEAVRGGPGGVAAGRARGGGQALLVGLMVLAFLVLVIARTTTPGSSGAATPDAAASAILPGVSPSAAADAATPSAVPSASAAASASAGPVGSASPGPTGTPGPSPSARPSAGASPTPVASGTRRYKVKSGDTLSGIAAKLGVTVKALLVANGITDPRLIRPGQVLVIP